MLNPDLVEYEAGEIDCWGGGSHYTTLTGYYPILNPLFMTLKEAADCCIEYAPDASPDIWWGIMETHIVSLEEHTGLKYHHPVDDEDLELFAEIVSERDYISSSIERWLEDEFPEREY